MLNRKQFIDMLAEEYKGLSKSTIDLMISVIIHGIKRAYLEYGGVRFVNFGAFAVRRAAARVGRNPTTLEEYPIAERNVPIFKPSEELKEAVKELEL